MEEDMDDFGDIYADVEGYVNAGVSMIPSIRQLYLEDRAKAELSPGGGGGSLDEERMPSDRIGGDGLCEGLPAPTAAAAATTAASHGLDGNPRVEGLGGGGDEGVTEVSNESDSDDDLRIVLNEEDCKRFVPPQRVGLGNGGILAGGCAKEDENDQSMVGNGVDHPSKDHKWADLSQLPVQGLEQSGLERCGTLKSGFVMPYSQFKYVRSQSSGCSSNAKSTGQECGLPLSSPMTSRGDWDMSGLLAATSCPIGFAVPRNRTVFDMSIESLDRRPWRNEGVDITDFFNFGLNEGSWKQYCDSMVLFRKQASWVARNTVCGSIRPNQAFDSGFLHMATSVDESLSEGAYHELGAKPKGKAIRVEGGSGERVPSVDIRRPRYLDSDVVIQIPVKGSDKDASMVPKEKPEHTDGFLPLSDNGFYGGSSKMDVVHDLATLCDDGHNDEDAVDVDRKKYPESGCTISREPEEKLQSLPDSKGVLNEKPRKMDVHVLGITPTSTEDVLHSSFPSSHASISESSKDDSSADKLRSPAKRSSFGSVTRSDISVGSSSDPSRADKVNDRGSSQDTSLYLEEQRCQSETELCGVVVEDGNDSTDLDKKVKNNSDSLRSYHGKLRKRDSSNHRGREHPSSMERTKMTKTCESWRYAGKRVSVNSYTERLRRSDLDPSSSGNFHKRYHCRKRRDYRQHDIKQTELKIPTEDEDGWGTKFVIRNEKCVHSVSDHMPFCEEKDWSTLHRSRRADDHGWCVKPNAIFEDRYMKQYIEGIQGNDSRQFPYFDRNEASRDKFDRNAPYRAWDRRSPEGRERDDRNLHIEMDDLQGYIEDDGEDWRYSNHRFLEDETFSGSPFVDGRVWHESSPPRIYRNNSERSRKIYVGHCGISGSRSARFNKQGEWDLLDPSTMDGYFSSCRDHHETGGGHYGVEERGYAPNTLFGEGRKSSHASRLRHVTEDQLSLRHQLLDDSPSPKAYFSCERNYRHENSCSTHKSLASLNFLHHHSVVNENGTGVSRKKYSTVKEQNSVRHRKAVNGRLNGYEGKLLGKCGEGACKKKKIRDDRVEDLNHMDEICRGNGNSNKRLKMEHNTHVIRSTVVKVEQCESRNYGTRRDEKPDEPGVMHDQDSGLEEGQLVEDEDTGIAANEWDTEGMVPISSIEVRHANDEKKKQVKETSNNRKSIEYDNSHILETLAKMEKRRERFKEPMNPKKEQGNDPDTYSKVMVVINQVKPERPPRKRRWGAVKDSAT